MGSQGERCGLVVAALPGAGRFIAEAQSAAGPRADSEIASALAAQMVNSASDLVMPSFPAGGGIPGRVDEGPDRSGGQRGTGNDFIC